MEILKREELATADEIAVMLGISVMAVRNSLNKMINIDVERIIIQKRNSRHFFIWKPIDIKISKDKMEKYK